MADAATTAVDGRRARGDRTRRIVLERATQLASVDGLSGLSIGGVAEAARVSKSGVATLFGSKERLELAVVHEAERIFSATVVEPARAAHPRGIRRVADLLERWLRYSQDRVFAGGCFFAAVSAEYDSRPGHVRDAISDARRRWTGYVEASLRHAVAAGDLDAGTDTAQLGFELEALLDFANTRSLLDDSSAPYDAARRAVVSRLVAAGADPAALTALTPSGSSASAAARRTQASGSSTP